MGQYMGVLCCSVLVPVNACVELLLEPVEGRLVCKSFRDNITAVRAASVWVNYHWILRAVLSCCPCLMLSLPTTTVSLFFSSPPLPVVLAYMSPSALFLLTEVGWMPANLPPMRMSHLICVCMHMCVCPSLLCSPFPQSTPSASLSPLSISTLVYVSLQKKKKKNAVSVVPFMSRRQR